MLPPPLSGISVICVESIVCLKVGVLRLQRETLAWTSTFWLSAPTVIFTLTEMLLPTSSTMPVWVGLKARRRPR
jgi:hypothetical protein